METLTYEVRTKTGVLVAVFNTEANAKEFAETKGYTVKNISPSWANIREAWLCCDYSGYDEVSIDGKKYYAKGRM